MPVMLAVMQMWGEWVPVPSPQEPSIDIRGLSLSQTTALLSSTGSLLLCRAVIKGLFVLPAVFFISRNLISSPLNIA